MRSRLTTLTALLLITTGCDRSTVVRGETRDLGAGSIRSWVALAPSGAPTALGVTLTEAALADLPADAQLTLALPPRTPFDRVGIQWAPGRHGREDHFDPGHFHLRFWLAARAAREPDRAAAIPTLEFIPASYVPAPGLVSRSGMHWMDPTAPEFNSASLTTSFLYGFQEGQMAFLEPVVARAFLDSGRSSRKELKRPRRYPRPGYYPTRYRVRYHAIAREYSVALEGLVRRP